MLTRCISFLQASCSARIRKTSNRGWPRVIPKNRAFVESILATQGLPAGDIKGIIDICHGLSVNDAFWVVSEGFDGSWHEYDLYENQLDAVLSLVAYTGHGTGQRRKAGLSAEWTTDGTYPKAWRRMGDSLVLYKGPIPYAKGVPILT